MPLIQGHDSGRCKNSDNFTAIPIIKKFKKTHAFLQSFASKSIDGNTTTIKLSCDATNTGPWDGQQPVIKGPPDTKQTL